MRATIRRPLAAWHAPPMPPIDSLTSDRPPMPSRHRLKLAVVLLMATGLFCDVASWYYANRLSADEQRLVGVWSSSSDDFPSYEFRADRSFRMPRLPEWQPQTSWRIKEDELIYYAVRGKGLLPLPDRFYKLAVLVPGASRVVYPRTIESSRYRIRWLRNGGAVLSMLSEDGRRAYDDEFCDNRLHRVAGDK
ncbi:hypothetical protein SAMN05421753_117100 [Planctomicrobium piriforme]|uniref:Uncharacterized protein n=1 Tax=Planctomicrobium piriforme TaxID=1576369 RepID=A0A1I3PZF1_9PLAN|nr:hypothetical protein SAMN05421753_117100 [Planctomicrobium piriforme]